MTKPLVTRGPKGIALTEAGTILYRHAEAILRHVEFAKQDAMSTLAVPSGHVAVGFLVSRAHELGELTGVDLAGRRACGFGELLGNELVHVRYAAYFGTIVSVIV